MKKYADIEIISGRIITNSLIVSGSEVSGGVAETATSASFAATASYIDSTFVSASAAASGFVSEFYPYVYANQVYEDIWSSALDGWLQFRYNTTTDKVEFKHSDTITVTFTAYGEISNFSTNVGQTVYLSAGRAPATAGILSIGSTLTYTNGRESLILSVISGTYSGRKYKIETCKSSDIPRMSLQFMRIQ